MTEHPAGIACNLDSPERARRNAWISDELLSRADYIEDVADGIVLRFDDVDAHTATVLEFVEVERKCCPFITFTLRYHAHQGPLTLTLAGSPEAKDFIKAELGITPTDSAV